jgi:hypothetical protein
MIAAAAVPVASARAAELVGSLRSMRHQHEVAREESYAFLATAGQIRQMVAAGQLVPVESNADMLVDGQVPHRFARPEVRLFLERLAAQYHAATGRRLVVTSLVRASAEQPPNAHRLSVHPAGMALDLRIPAIGGDRQWLERTLLALEADGVLDVTREKRPPHYHVAVFPAEYRAHVAARDAQPPVAVPAPAAPSAAVVALAGHTARPVNGEEGATGPRVPLQATAAGLALVLGLGLFRGAERRRSRRA